MIHDHSAIGAVMCVTASTVDGPLYSLPIRFDGAKPVLG